jgi:hypothetical protein
MPRFAVRQGAGADRQPFNPAKPPIRPIVGSIVGFAPVVAVLAGLGVMLADPSRDFGLSVVALGALATLVAVLAVHRRATGRLREALATAETEVAAHARSGRQT